MKLSYSGVILGLIHESQCQIQRLGAHIDSQQEVVAGLVVGADEDRGQGGDLAL